MLRSRLLVSVATPLLAVSLLLPSAALASPYARSVPLLGMQDPGGESLAQPIPGQTPVTPVNTQLQAPGSQSQGTPGTTVAGPQSQSQTLTVPGNGTVAAPPGGVVMQPQIQVLVQPQIQVQAQPQGNASPTSSADISTNTNSTATPTVTTDARTTNTSSAPPPAPPSPPVYVAPPQQRYPQTRYAPPPPPPRIVTRVVSRPSHAAPPAAIKRPPPPRKGLMVTGWILFSVSYLVTASNAADLYDRCPGMKNAGRCRDLAENMFIPVVGPFLAMEQARFATDDFSLAVSGGLQGLGLIMGIAGTVQYHRDRYRNRVLNEYGVRVTKNTSINAGSRVGGGQVTLTARF